MLCRRKKKANQALVQLRAHKHLALLPTLALSSARNQAQAAELCFCTEPQLAAELVEFHTLPAGRILKNSLSAFALDAPEKGKRGELERLLLRAASFRSVSSDEYDAIVLAVIEKAPQCGADFVKRLQSEALQVRALLMLGKYKPAYLLAVRVGRKSVREVLAWGKTPSATRKLCSKFLSKQGEKVEASLLAKLDATE